MTYFAAKHSTSLTAVEQTVVPDQRVRLIRLFHFYQLAGIFLA